MTKAETKLRLDRLRRKVADALRDGRVRKRLPREIRRDVQALDIEIAAVSAVVFGQKG